MLGLRFCARAFSSCGKQGSLFIVVHGPFTVAASLVAGHRLQTRRLSSCGSRASCSAACGTFPDQGCVPCIGRQILNHCATREALLVSLSFTVLSTCPCCSANLFCCMCVSFCSYDVPCLFCCWFFSQVSE